MTFGEVISEEASGGDVFSRQRSAGGGRGGDVARGDRPRAGTPAN